MTILMIEYFELWLTDESVIGLFLVRAIEGMVTT